MALTTQALHVAFVIKATLGQGCDVIALCSQPDASLALAFSTQGIGSEQRRTQRLQLAAGDAFGCFG